jgi:hypothetical protein
MVAWFLTFARIAIDTRRFDFAHQRLCGEQKVNAHAFAFVKTAISIVPPRENFWFWV